ncbi:helix-turn-helix domain-containing protein [Catenulispora sp. NF23]|uniref:Helix-turn-helix domain-containing protein n=1 Tax=Catenulispora pinistramenti TaxID=2705254 RepID=A0ABS5KIM1_9ACTN|nr:helix-turn-helix domain-containing protein [Catenulispora pinistramenti]MBS2531973.1 helix-turn-helix domain-containing protein [Catenulispora pinistramenti]MBS2546241.1 helix-turn-helix domain-containing protein [Catenulispora pinistramenti]
MARTPELARLGDAVRQRRTAKEWYQRDLAAAAKVSIGTVRNIEQGKGASGLILAQLERALGWITGSAAQILDGGDPELIRDEPASYVSSRTGTPIDLSEIPLEELQAEVNRRVEAAVRQAVAANPHALRT